MNNFSTKSIKESFWRNRNYSDIPTHTSAIKKKFEKYLSSEKLFQYMLLLYILTYLQCPTVHNFNDSGIQFLGKGDQIIPVNEEVSCYFLMSKLFVTFLINRLFLMNEQ